VPCTSDHPFTGCWFCRAPQQELTEADKASANAREASVAVAEGGAQEEEEEQEQRVNAHIEDAVRSQLTSSRSFRSTYVMKLSVKTFQCFTFCSERTKPCSPFLIGRSRLRDESSCELFYNTVLCLDP